MTEKLKLKQLEKMENHRSGYGCSFDIRSSAIMKDGDLVPVTVVMIQKGSAHIEIPVDPEGDFQVSIFEYPYKDKSFEKEMSLKAKIAKAALEADLYSISEDGVNTNTSWSLPTDKEDWAKRAKHWELLDKMYEANDELFDFKVEQSKEIKMEFHQAAFDLKKEIVKKMKELNLGDWQEREEFKKALEFQGISMADTDERNWCSSSADCRHMFHAHDDVTSKLK